MLSIEERLERFARQMDGVSASNNLSMSALNLRYGSIVRVETEEDVVLVVPRKLWFELTDQADMFMAVMTYIREQEQGESNGND